MIYGLSYILPTEGTWSWVFSTGISSQNILSGGRQKMKSRKNEKSRIDLQMQAYLIKEGRGRGDLTKYDTTFPFEDDQFNYLSKYQNQYF